MSTFSQARLQWKSCKGLFSFSAPGAEEGMEKAPTVREDKIRPADSPDYNRFDIVHFERRVVRKPLVTKKRERERVGR